MEPEDSLPCSQEPPLIPVLSYKNPVNIVPTCLFKIYSHISFHPRLSSEWSFPLRFPDRNFV